MKEPKQEKLKQKKPRQPRDIVESEVKPIRYERPSERPKPTPNPKKKG